MSKTFTAKCVFGLGVTSSTDFVRLAARYKPLRDIGIEYINASTQKYPSRAGVVVFEGVRELFRCVAKIKPHQVLVVSEIPSLIKEVADWVALDFDNTRSFEFNFKPVDITAVIRAVRSKTLSVTSSVTTYDNLGYHVDRVSSSDKFIASWLALTSALAFNRRDIIKRGMVRFLGNKRCNPAIVISAVQDAVKGTTLFDEQVKQFVDLFEANANAYHQAINSELAPAISSKRFGVDQYAITYMKRMLRSTEVTNARLVRNESRIETAS